MSRVWQLFRRSDTQTVSQESSPAAVLSPPEEITGVLDTYRVPAGANPDSSAQVFVVEEDGLGRYLVRLPGLDREEENALNLLRLNLLDSIPAEANGDPRGIVSDYVMSTADGLGIAGVVDESHEKLLYYLMREFSGFWEVDPLVNDDYLEEISVCRHDRPVRVLHRNFSHHMFMETDIVYPSEERLQAFVRRLARLGGTTISLAQPSLEVTLHGPSDRRVTATLGDEISRPGSTYAIRKQRESPITLAQLAAPERARWPPLSLQNSPEPPPYYDEVHSHKTLSVLMAAYFWLLLERTTNVIVAGESVDHDEPILIREEGRIRLTRIGDLVDRYFRPDQQGRKLVDGIDVVCFDPSTLRNRWSPLRYVYRHKHGGKLLRFSLRTGRQVAVTRDHSVFILKNGKVACVKASEIRKGDFIVAPRGIGGNEEARVVVDLVKELAGIDGIYLYGVPPIVFDRFSAKLKQDSWRDWKHDRRLPIRYGYLLSEEEKKIVRLGYKGSPIRLDAHLEIDEGFARLLGFYAAEGWSHLEPKKQYTMGLSFGDEDEEPVRLSLAILMEKFRIQAHLKKANRSRVVIFSHRVLAELFVKWVGTGASSQKVPDVILSSPSSVRRAFVSGWAAGDHDGTVSRELSNGISYLLLMDNCISTTSSRWTEADSTIDGRVITPRHPLYETKFPSHRELVSGDYRLTRTSGEPYIPTAQLPNPLHELQSSNYPAFKSMSPSLVSRIGGRLARMAARAANDRRYNPFYAQNIVLLQDELVHVSRLQESFTFLKITDIDEVQPTAEYVYDVSVPGCENFLAGFGGVFCHNTNSGKTTLMNAVLALADPKCKIVTAEDVLEISLPDHLHWQRLKTRAHRAGLSPTSGRYEYGLPELLKLALRFSPTILSLGEMRGEESETVAAAITLGFSTMTTIHAENAERCVQRLTTPPMRFSAGHIRDITAIATMRKVVLQDGRVVRRVVSVDEVRPQGSDGHEIINVFRYDPASDSFRPTTPAEVLDNSFRLNEIADSFGWSPAAVQRSLSVRAARISGRIAEGELTPQALSKMVREFSSEKSRRGAERGWEGE